MSITAESRLDVPTAVYPGLEPRLLTVADPEDRATYRGAGGYRILADPEALLASVEECGLRGRGGAGFPFARKVRTVRQGFAAPVVLANGEEGEPASVKDRWLMRHRPHLVLDGLRLAAAMVGAQEAYVYVSDAVAAASIEAALAEYPASGWAELEVRVHRVDPSYVAGEETAAVRSINGGPALPEDKPPRPFEEGIGARPTLVSNIETLANLPAIQRLGTSAYRAAGTAESAGTFLMTLHAPATGTGLYEVPFGVTLREVLEWRGEDCSRVGGALVGGYFAGVLSERVLDLPLEYAAYVAAGSGLGCGAIAVIDERTCAVAVAAGVMRYFDHANAGQCGSCFNGTAAMAAALEALTVGAATPDDVERLRRWSQDLRGRGACGTLDGATNVAASVLHEFPQLVHEHVAGVCAQCAVPDATAYPPYEAAVRRHGLEIVLGQGSR